MSLKGLIALTAVGVLAVSVGVGQGSHGTTTQPNGDDDTYGEMKCVLDTGGPVALTLDDVFYVGGVAAVQQDGGPYVNDTDGGVFQLEGSATCTGEDTSGNSTGEFGPQVVDISAHGTYTSLVCGTMRLDGVMNLNRSSPGLDLTLKFGIDLKATAGKIVTSHADGFVTIGTTTNDVDDGSGDGFINFLPGDGQSCVNDADGVTLWDVAGNFTVGIAGDAQANDS